MKKIMASLTEETDEMLRRYVKEAYYNRRGALSIVVEAALQDFLRRNGVEPRPD